MVTKPCSASFWANRRIICSICATDFGVGLLR